MRPLTDRQQEVLQAIQAHIYDHGSPPTVRDLMRQFGFKSPEAIMCHLRALTEKGWLRREVGSNGNSARALTVCEPPPSFPASLCDCLPVLGKVDSDTGRITFADTSILDDAS